MILNEDSISIVMATYNGERFIKEQLDSLSSQSLLPKELLVGDDGSTDSTIALVKRFAASSPFPVHLIQHSRHLGATDNFLVTATLASGSLLAFCDQDDIWRPQKLQKVTETFASSSEIMAVGHNSEEISADGTPMRDRLKQMPPSTRFPRGSGPVFAVAGHTMTIRREVLTSASPNERLGIHDEAGNPFGHDHWLWLLATCLGDSVILSDRLVAHRVHDQNVAEHVVGMERILLSLREASEHCRLAEVNSMNLAKHMNRLAASWDDRGCYEWAAGAVNVSADLRRRAEHLAERRRLYESDRLTAAKQWIRMVRSGSYLGRESIAKDAFLILVGSRAWSRVGKVDQQPQ